jgi:ribonucleotide reductase beta subunit family protein with ferritin-like domain
VDSPRPVLSNELISRDEALHRIRYSPAPSPTTRKPDIEARASEMIVEAVEIETNFITEASCNVGNER